MHPDSDQRPVCSPPGTHPLMPVAGWWRQPFGLVKSWWIYRRPGRQAGLRALYRDWLPPGSLAFDIGAHLGDRTRCFRSLGSRVVALEPQPALMRLLERAHGQDPDVVLCPQAVGHEPGRARLALSHAHPTLATLDHAWREEVKAGNEGFRDVRWDDQVEVEVTTLDALIETHGLPDFCKIDVEGFEAAVLAGLSQPLPALSFEFVHGTLSRSQACVDRLETLGTYEYNLIAGEERRYRFERWLSGADLTAWLAGGADQLPSGDIYARLIPAPEAKDVPR